MFLLWDLFNGVTETLEEAVTPATRIQKVIRDICIFFKLTDALGRIITGLYCSI